MWTARLVGGCVLLLGAAACHNAGPRYTCTDCVDVQDSNEPATYVPGPATALVVTTQPGQVSTNNVFTVSVAFRDANNMTAAPPAVGMVTVSLAGNSNLQLGGVVQQNVVNSAVTFANLRVLGAGNNLSLHFAAGALTADSNQFSAHDSAWTERQVVAVGGAPVSGRMWFSDLDTYPPPRPGGVNYYAYAFGQLHVSVDGGNTLVDVGNANGFVGVAEDPFNANHLIGQTQDTTVWASQDNGQSWQITLPAYYYFRANPHIFFSPQVANVVHVVTGTGGKYGLSRSEDGGQTWTPELACSHASINLQGNLYAVAPNFKTILYSGDGGQRWTSNNPALLQPENVIAEGIAADPTVEGTAYLLVGNANAGLYVTNDYGASWTAAPLVNTPVNYDPNDALHFPTITACADAAHTAVYAGSSDVLLTASPDHGATWEYAGYGVQEATAGRLTVCDPRNALHVFTTSDRNAFETHSGGQ